MLILIDVGASLAAIISDLTHDVGMPGLAPVARDFLAARQESTQRNAPRRHGPAARGFPRCGRTGRAASQTRLWLKQRSRTSPPVLSYAWRGRGELVAAMHSEQASPIHFSRAPVLPERGNESESQVETERRVTGGNDRQLSATMHSLKLCAVGIDRKSARQSWHGSLRSIVLNTWT